MSAADVSAHDDQDLPGAVQVHAGGGPGGSLASLTQALKAAGEDTRLRILALLAQGERSVKDITDILNQSQPRVSRHLKLLLEAGLIDRHREGTWAFFRLADTPEGALAAALVARLDTADAILSRDRLRLNALIAAHGETAGAYFAENAAQWDQLRSLHADDGEIEAVIRAMAPETIALMVDLGTGTARMLELLQDRFARAIGIDQSPAMLGYARTRLEASGLTRAQVRLGEIHDLPREAYGADFVILHQVLHYLVDPAAALRQACAILAPGGRLMVVDFEPHDLEFLRSEHAHRRLGFSTSQIAGWAGEAGAHVIASQSIEAPGKQGSDSLDVGIWVIAKPDHAEGRA